MNRDKQIKKVRETYDTMCCLLVYNNKVMLNKTIEDFIKEVEKLKL